MKEKNGLMLENIRHWKMKLVVKIQLLQMMFQKK